MKSNYLQKFVARHYDGGTCAHVEVEHAAEDWGDDLFLFIFREAGSASSFGELAHTMAQAADQLRSLAEEASIAQSAVEVAIKTQHPNAPL